MKAEDIAAELERTLPVMQEEAVKVMRAAVDLAVDRERGLAPGRIGTSVSGLVRENATGVSGTIRPRSKIAGLVDKGTGLLHESGFHHAITPTRAKVLKFVGHDGQTYYRREIKGQRPQLFVERTRDELAVEVEGLLAAGAQAATDRLF